MNITIKYTTVVRAQMLNTFLHKYLNIGCKTPSEVRFSER